MIRSVVYILTILVFIISGCGTENKHPIENTSIKHPETELKDATIVLTDKGIRNAVVRAAYIAKYSDTKETFARELDADFYDDNGIHTSNLVSDSGWINEEDQNMEVLGHVVVVNSDGVKLETESLTWDQSINRVVTDDFVKITRGNDILTGYGLITDQRMESIKILKDVKGKIEEVPEDELEG